MLLPVAAEVTHCHRRLFLTTMHVAEITRRELVGLRTNARVKVSTWEDVYYGSSW